MFDTNPTRNSLDQAKHQPDLVDMTEKKAHEFLHSSSFFGLSWLR